MKVAVVGATGLVGSKMLQVLAERNFPVDELIPVASERSIGKEVEFKGKKYKIVGYRKHPDGYRVEDDAQKIEFPLGTSIDIVIDRMIAILQSSAENC